MGTIAKRFGESLQSIKYELRVYSISKTFRSKVSNSKTTLKELLDPMFLSQKVLGDWKRLFPSNCTRTIRNISV